MKENEENEDRRRNDPTEEKTLKKNREYKISVKEIRSKENKNNKISNEEKICKKKL